MRLSDTRFVALDCETSGLDPEKAELLEVAAVEFDWTEEAVDDDLINDDPLIYHSLCKPTRPIPFEVSAIHGIVDEDVENAPSRSEVNAYLTEWFSGDRIAIAHNAEYDRAVLRDPLGDVPWLCTERMSHHFLDIPNYKLATVRYALREPGERLPHYGKAHGALADTLVLVEVFKKLLALYRVLPGVDFEAEDASERLIEFVARPYAIKTLPFGKHRGQPIASVPASYLAWMLEKMPDLRPDTRAGVELELQRRDQRAEAIA